MKTAFVTSLGSVASDIVIKSLKRHGFRVVGCDIYPKEWVVDAASVEVFYQAPYAAEEEKYLAFVRNVCETEKVRYLLPLIDVEVDLFNRNREWFEAHGVVLCISPKPALDIIRNKKALADFVAGECDVFSSIPTLLLKDMKMLPWAFPVVCKPYNGRSSQGLNYIYNQIQWENFLSAADKSVYIVEPFIKGSVVVVDIVRQSRSHQVVAIPRREMLRTPHGCATTVYMYQDKELEEKSKRLAEALGVEGCVNFELILDEEGVYHFMECNPRFSAGCEFSCMSGYDCVGNHMRCFDGREIEPFTFQHSQYIARKYEEFITRIEES